jgi:hypothetical protein
MTAILGTGRCRLEVSVGQDKKCEIISKKITKSKMDSGIAQVVVHLPSKHRGPEFKPYYHQKKKREGKGWRLNMSD